METILSHVAQLVVNVISLLGYFGVFLAMTLESACIPLPSEIILPFTGYIPYSASQGITLYSYNLPLDNVINSS